MSGRVDVVHLKPGVVRNEMSGEDEPSWSVPPVETPYAGLIWWPEMSSESPTPDRPLYVMTALVVSFPFGSPVAPGDRVRLLTGPYAGLWEVDGRPAHWASPYEDWTPGASVRLVEVTG